MGDIIALLWDRYPGPVVVGIVIVYLALEFALDIVHEFVVDWIKEVRKRGKNSDCS